MGLNEYDYDEYSGYAGESISAYTVKTFLWMFLGLMTTFAVALFGYVTGTIVYVFAIPYFHIILLVAELAVVLVLSARLQTLTPC